MTLEDLSKLCDAATRGPWATENIGNRFSFLYDLRSQSRHWDQSDEAFSRGGWMPFDVTTEQNAAFISMSRTYMPLLLKVAEATSALVEALDNQKIDPSDTDYDERAAAAVAQREVVRRALKDLEAKSE